MADTAALRAKLAARRGRPEYAENCREIEAEIARLENTDDQAAGSQDPDQG